MIQLSVLVALAVWLAQQPGEVSLSWAGLDARIHAGAFLAALALVIAAILLLHRLWIGLLSLPRRIRTALRMGQLERGYLYLTRGLSALAAGDAKLARYFAWKARNLKVMDDGLPTLIEAQAARMRGDAKEARNAFERMLEHKDSAFLGLRGLLQSALDSGDFVTALDRARQARALHPKQPWIVRAVYDLEIRARDWDSAIKTMKQAVKLGAMTQDQADSDLVAILVHQAGNDLRDGNPEEAIARLKRVRKINPAFIPMATLLARILMERKDRRGAASIIEQAWKVNTHPELAAIWEQLAPEKSDRNPTARLKWFERLVELTPGSAEGQLMMARAMMDEQLWGEARGHLILAERTRPSARLYRLWAQLEDVSMRNHETARIWLEKAAEAPPGKCWVCTLTGRIYDRWSAIAEPHGSFNSIVWDFPQGRADMTLYRLAAIGSDPLLLSS